MNVKQANLIAHETLYVLYGCKEMFPGAYEYFVSEMDISDDEIEAAVKMLFPETR